MQSRIVKRPGGSTKTITSASRSIFSSPQHSFIKRLTFGRKNQYASIPILLTSQYSIPYLDDFQAGEATRSALPRETFGDNLQAIHARYSYAKAIITGPSSDRSVDVDFDRPESTFNSTKSAGRGRRSDYHQPGPS